MAFVAELGLGPEDIGQRGAVLLEFKITVDELADGRALHGGAGIESGPLLDPSQIQPRNTLVSCRDQILTSPVPDQNVGGLDPRGHKLLNHRARHLRVGPTNGAGLGRDSDADFLTGLDERAPSFTRGRLAGDRAGKARHHSVHSGLDGSHPWAHRTLLHGKTDQ